MKFWILGFILCLGFVFIGCQSHMDSGNAWSAYRGGPESDSYSPLDQIDKKTVKNLEVAWVFKPKDAPNGKRQRSQSNPIVVNGVMYTVSGHGSVYALNAATGKKIWSYDPFDGATIELNKIRGVTYWDGEDNQYILFSTGHYLIELDAKTGKIAPEFGDNGKIDLKQSLRNPADEIVGIVRITSPGVVYKNLVIYGSRSTGKYGDIPGDIRAFNVHTGKIAWIFHTIPRPGEFGYDTWPKDAWKYASGANDWAGLSVDEKRGIVFLATASPSYDFYGGYRKGKNLFGNSVVALNASTGKRIWHFQAVHHDLWDYDLASPPVLVTVKRNGKNIDAVVGASKNGFLFVLNRVTGDTLFPVVEKKVPASTVPGEYAWPTQPFPLKPAPFANQQMHDSLVADYSPEIHNALLKKFHSFTYEGLFTPPSLKGSFELPATIGGVEWGSLAFDQKTNILYVRSNNNEAEIETLERINPKKGKAAGNGKNKLSKGFINMTLYNQGVVFYAKTCAVCHGADRKGGGDIPSLLGLEHHSMTRAAVLKQINMGGQHMPAFSQVLSSHQKEAIIAYLFNDKKVKSEKIKGLESKRRSRYQTMLDRGLSPDMPMYRNKTAFQHFTDGEGRPGIKPPWNLLSAINLNTGDYEWQIETGGRGRGPIVTAGGLLFMGVTERGKAPELRAYDKDTGKVIWKKQLPAGITSTASTYMVDGKQYITFPIAGTKDNPGGAVMAFALP